MSIPKHEGRQKPKVLNVDVLDNVQEAWQLAADADADLTLEDNNLNAHFAYDDEDNHVRHQVWFLDAVTALNQLRGARDLGLQTFALWRLGSEDRSLWTVWDKPSSKDAPKALSIASAWARRGHRRRRRHSTHHRTPQSNGIAHR